MLDMPRPRPDHLHREVTRHGKTVWYFRIGQGPRVRIKGEYGTPGFNNAYQAALSGQPVEQASRGNKPGLNTLGWLIARYRDSAAWSGLAAATRRQRGNLLAKIEASEAARKPFTKVTKKTITAALDRRAGTPDGARHFLLTMRGLFAWAVEAEHARIDPTAGIKAPRSKGDGHEPWTPEWCAAYEKRWPIGTKERVWYEVLYRTGLRRGDAVMVGKQHVRGQRGMIKAEKNGETAFFIVGPELQAVLDAGPTGELAFVCGDLGQPLTKETFGNYFREACRAAGVPGSAHGLRKTRATIEAERGASEAKLNALFGWRTGSGMSSIYTKKANRERLAFEGLEQESNVYSRTYEPGAGAKRKTSTKSKG